MQNNLYYEINIRQNNNKIFTLPIMKDHTLLNTSYKNLNDFALIIIDAITKKLNIDLQYTMESRYQNYIGIQYDGCTIKMIQPVLIGNSATAWSVIGIAETLITWISENYNEYLISEDVFTNILENSISDQTSTYIDNATPKIKDIHKKIIKDLHVSL